MAEASSARSLASMIDRNYLECSICTGPFDDPRALPCLHPFCCGCLENWVKACSKDGKVVSCPLCKKVYQIPEDEGIKGFPAHFLVADLQSTVYKAKQKQKSDGDICANHGKKIEYFCENCDCSTCSDCAALDHNHQGHSFIRLREASQRQIRSLETLTRRIRNVERKCMSAIQQAQQVEEDLDRNAEAKIEAIDTARSEHIRQVNRLVGIVKQDVYQKKEEKMNAIQQNKEQLQINLDTMRNSRELASNVVESSSHSDIISLYPSLSSSLQQFAQFQPSSVDSTLSQIQLKPTQQMQVELPSLEQLIGDKLNITMPPSGNTQPGDQSNSHLSAKTPIANLPASTAPLSLPVVNLLAPAITHPLSPPTNGSSEPASVHQRKLGVGSQKVATKSAAKPTAPKGSWFNLFSIFNVRNMQPRKEWKETGQIKTTPHVTFPRGIAIHRNGDIAVTTDHGDDAPVTVFSRNGDFKHIIDGSSHVFDIAITPSNLYIIPGKKHSEEFYIYDSQGVQLRTIPTYDINNKPYTPKSVALDSNDRIIVGGYHGDKTVSIHQLDGTLVSKVETNASPHMLTCTPDDKLIISFEDTLQVMDQSGDNASIIQPPPDIESWAPAHVCCSKQGELFVSNLGNKGVYRYVFTEGVYVFQDCVTMMKFPSGIALSADEAKLFVVDSWNDVIKMFK